MPTSPTATEVLALAAAIVSAVGGGFSALAAWRSAQSARHAQDSADSADRRGQLRELAATANTVVVEESRIKARAIGLRQEYRSLAILSGGSGGSRQQLFLDAIDEKERQAVERADDARKFIDGARSLRESTAEDIDRVQHRLANSLEVVRAMREDLDREMLAVEGQSAERRAAMEGTRLAR